MYLDLVSSRDAFSTGALFQPTFGFAPSFDIRAQGTYRRGFDGGFSFMRSANGRPQFRSPFAPLAGASPEQYWDLNDPLFTNVMWSVGRGATLAQLTPVFSGLVAGQLQAAGLDAATAQAQAGALAAALPSLIPEQLGGLNNSLMSLNLKKLRLEMRRLLIQLPMRTTFLLPVRLIHTRLSLATKACWEIS